jgi:hypothetical protein
VARPGSVSQATAAPRPAARIRGCRAVTTAESARLLLMSQLRALDDIEWTVVSGDVFADAPLGMETAL